jgi:hypothetical protein
MARDASSVKSLKVLSRKYPELDELLFIIGMGGDEREEADRTAAIVAGALLDMFLELAIRTKFIHEIDPEAANNIFRNNGPLSSFSARIAVAYALGIYDEVTRTELDNIREIRNAFSHTVGKITFDMDEVANVCKRLVIPDAYPPDDRKMVRTAKQRFTLSARICWVLLSDSLHWQTHHTTVEPFLARVQSQHPELMPLLRKSPEPPPSDPQNARHTQKGRAARRRSSRESK